MADKQVVLIAGPTASGKTRVAVTQAVRLGARVVNADSMQVYDGLNVLTARPEAHELAAAPHHLFGHVDPATRYSTGAWLADAEKQIQDADAMNQPLVFVGGTGLYFDALTKGFAQVPPVPADLIQAVEQEVSVLDEPGRRALLEANDPETASSLSVADPQRVVRALAVLRSTGRTLSAFRADNGVPLLAGRAVTRMALAPPRAVLRARIAERFEAMMARGALDEVRALLGRGLDPSLPAMKAIGVPELSACLAGALSREEAVERAITASRQLAKRQMTFLRGRLGDWPMVEPEG